MPSTQVWAQAADAAAENIRASGSNDIIVTARRQEERLQDVPISITVFDQKQIDNRNVVSALDLAKYTPSLAANSRFGAENTTFSIRGFYQELRTTASVAVYFADVVSPRGGGSTSGGDGAGPGSFFDLQNVQVLKGPQGTLFGRNTTGGAILLVPRKPEDTFGGYVEGRVGNYGMRRVQSVVNTPIGDQARLRLGVDWQDRDGYLRNIAPTGPDRFADINYVAARASLVVDLTPDLENYTIASYTRSDNNGPIPKVTNCNTTRNGATLPTGLLSCDQFAREQGLGRYVVENTVPRPGIELDQWQIINTTTLQASDSLTIKNIASYAQLTSTSRTEAFGTRWIMPETFLGQPTGDLAGRELSFVPVMAAPGLASNDQSTFSEELQFSGSAGAGRLTWQAGAYYEKSNPLGTYGNQNPSNLSCADSDTFQCVDALGRVLGREGRQGSLSRQLTRTTFRNIGLYGQATFDVTDSISLTGGIRYTWDKTNSVARKQVIRFPAENDARIYCLNPALGPNGPVQNPDGSFDFSNSIDPAAAATACQQSIEQKSKAPTWMLGADFKPADNILLYAKYSRGYRQGSTNPFGGDGFETFGPEKVDTYEVGAKTSWSGAMPGNFNIAGYYNDFTDQQVQLGLINLQGLVAPNTAIVNAGSSRIYGVEVEAAISPFAGFDLSASYGYLNTKLKTLTPVTIPPGSLYNFVLFTSLAGEALPYSPKHQASVTASYSLPLPESVGTVTLSGTYSYRSKLITTYTSAEGTLRPLSLLDLNLNWESVAGSPIDLGVFATNVTNKYYYTHVNEQSSSGFISRYLGEPRMYGLRVRYRFD
ncbi:TonB-dependent receptor [Novosphingobium endophyticum]|uniref:TonB-dependent receptor n=1 Tax=Novosphingobium endophyticum TaxID=1955250 RepID=A0A916X2S5_9SPHN|nr:TonB-dependent receptor [Novosphingobium endophyticum]GGB85812.1 TonB-dependent receptor [Novosphingobium endophyticum]